MQPILSFENVHKSYGDKTVLKDVSLHVHTGEILGVIGLNGVGKTTLLKLLLGLAKMDQGRIVIDGMPAQQAKSRNNLVYVPEKLQPSPNLTGREYLRLALKSYGQPLQEDALLQMLKSMALDVGMLDKRTRHYSKGMAQKLGLSAAFLTSTPIMVLDEPMSGLDPKARYAVKHAMRAAKEKGRTVFFSSHILADIEEICDRIVIIHNAQVQFLGEVQQFFVAQKAGAHATLEAQFLSLIEATHHGQ